jgi:predicted RNA-binding Zn-ribbon protein involved in translation (DUF1610 family)
MDYYIQWECPSCDATNYYGLCRTMIEHKGEPVIMLGEGEQTSFECEHCGKEMYTGELEQLTEDEI